jgi:hypothetical protein
MTNKFILKLLPGVQAKQKDCCSRVSVEVVQSKVALGCAGQILKIKQADLPERWNKTKDELL